VEKTWKIRWTVKTNSPLIGPPKGINMDKNVVFVIFSVKNRVLYKRFLAFYGGPGGFRELREACRKHFHGSWYLFEPGVTSYDRKT